MLIRDCVLKYVHDDIWLYHTRSSYKVRMNVESVGVLKSMIQRNSPADMTANEKSIYNKLSPRGIVGADTGCEQDRLITVRKGSPLEIVELEFSGRCNLRCLHCFAALSQKDMDQKSLDKVFEGIDALEPINLVLNGGEPLLNPLLPEVLEGARERKMRVSVMTNGTLVNDEKADLLRTYGTAKVIVSLDFFEETHDSIRGAGSFGRAVQGIERLTSRGVPVAITAMVQDSTAGQLEDFEKFCLGELGVSGIRFSSIVPVGKAKDAAPALRLSATGVRELFSKGLISEGDGRQDSLSALVGSRKFPCTAGESQCFISADGKVYACHYFQNIGECMGDLSEGSLEKIYREYPKSGATTADFDWDKMKQCTACEHFAHCLGGCRARARTMANDWYMPDPYSCEMHGVERNIGDSRNTITILREVR